MKLKYDTNGCVQLNKPGGFIVWDRKENLGDIFPKYVKIFSELYQGTLGSSVTIDLVKTEDIFMYKYHTHASVGLRIRWADETSASTIKFLLDHYVELLHDNKIATASTHWVVFTKARVLDSAPRWLTKGKSETQVQSIMYDSMAVYYNDKFENFIDIFDKTIVNEFYLFTGYY